MEKQDFKKQFLAIHELTLQEAMEKTIEMLKKGVLPVCTTYSMKEFVNKLSLKESIEWWLFNQRLFEKAKNNQC